MVHRQSITERPSCVNRGTYNNSVLKVAALCCQNKKGEKVTVYEAVGSIVIQILEGVIDSSLKFPRVTVAYCVAPMPHSFTCNCFIPLVCSVISLHNMLYCIMN